jgi:20S proteasome subunit beta 4
MDSVFGICGKDWVILVADAAVNRSIMTLKHDEDKIDKLNNFKLLASSGEQTERYQFSNFIKRNLALQEYKTGHEPDVEGTAQWMRTEMATALRSRSPFQVNCLMGGYDHIDEEAKLYWLDYLGTLQQVNKGAHGYAGYFVNSVLDNHFKQDMTIEQGKEACRACITELRTRFMINQPSFIAKIVTKDGAEVIKLE